MTTLTHAAPFSTDHGPATGSGSESATPVSSARSGSAPPIRLGVEYWTVSMDGDASCGSCDATLTVVAEAVEVLGPLAARLGIAIEVRTRTVTTWADAVDHGIVASPTVRSAGLVLRPTHPDTTETRVWTWRGTTTASPSPEAVLEFLLHAVTVRSRQIDEYYADGGPEPYVRQYLQSGSAEELGLAPQDLNGAGCGCGSACS